MRIFSAWGLATVVVVLLPTDSRASALLCSSVVQFCTDGTFNAHTNGSPTSEGPEWTPGGNVTSVAFPRVGQTGGSVLYAGLGTGSAASPGDTLYLMYDYIAGPDLGFGQPAFQDSFFDVFFELPLHDEDYVVRIFASGGFSVFEKDSDTLSPLTPEGNFDLNSPVWEPVSQQDLALARFQVGIGFGVSPNDPVRPHPIAEFELSVDRSNGSPGGPTGIYDPAPAFWSASVGLNPGQLGTTIQDPPISSAIFTLSLNTTSIVPVLNSRGGPIQQRTPAPEPATLVLVATGVLGAAVRWRSRRSRRP